MAMKYQKGTVCLRGQKVKMWYGKYTVYLRNEEGKEIGKRRNTPLCPKAGTPKWKAKQMLYALILNKTGVPAKTSSAISDESVTFRWFVEKRYIPMRENTWNPAYRKINSYEIKHYLVEHFGRIALGQLGALEIQVWFNKLATQYSQSVIRHCYASIRAITHMAKKQKYMAEDPAEDVTMPQIKPVEKPLMGTEQILALIGDIQDLHDLCLMYIGIFCGPRASEVMGLQWKS
jgi:integrase